MEATEIQDPTKPTKVKGGRVLPPLATRLKNLKPRVKGELNKISRTLKEAILLAGETVGSDGRGKDGLHGYLTLIAKTEPVAFCSLLGKVLPLTIVGDKNNPVQHQVTVTLVRSERSSQPAPKVINAKPLQFTDAITQAKTINAKLANVKPPSTGLAR